MHYLGYKEQNKRNFSTHIFCTQFDQKRRCQPLHYFYINIDNNKILALCWYVLSNMLINIGYVAFLKKSPIFVLSLQK